MVPRRHRRPAAGGQALPLDALTVCGLFRWNGRKLVPVLVTDGHATEFLSLAERYCANLFPSESTQLKPKEVAN
jgi:hypothetical protein